MLFLSVHLANKQILMLNTVLGETATGSKSK